MAMGETNLLNPGVVDADFLALKCRMLACSTLLNKSMTHA